MAPQRDWQCDGCLQEKSGFNKREITDEGWGVVLDQGHQGVHALRRVRQALPASMGQGQGSGVTAETFEIIGTIVFVLLMLTYALTGP